MGLDMYAFSAKPKNEETKKEILENFLLTGKAEIDPIEIAYWRKHYPLHEWMEALYKEKGGERSFNCINLILTSKDLDNLEYAVQTALSFKGNGHYSNNIKFLEIAREELARGNVVYYTSWW